MKSVNEQSYENKEYIIIDGASIDKTLEIAKYHSTKTTKIYSEPDSGIYHAINKGILRSSGDVIGLVHSDDFLSNANVLSKIAKLFREKNCDFIYSNLDFVLESKENKVVRRWIPGKINREKVSMGWVPPHPTLFIKREVISKLGLYDTNFKIAADFDFLLRLFKSPFKGHYLDMVTYKMRFGGISTNPKSILEVLKEDIRILKKNEMPIIRPLIIKKFGKIIQHRILF